MWSRLRRNRFLWTMLGAMAVAYIGRSMMRDGDRRSRDRATRQMTGMVDMLSRTGRSVANGTMRMVRR